MNVMGPLDYLRARLTGTDDNPLGMTPLDAHYAEPDPYAPPPPPDPMDRTPIISPGYRQPVG